MFVFFLDGRQSFMMSIIISDDCPCDIARFYCKKFKFVCISLGVISSYTNEIAKFIIRKFSRSVSPGVL